MDDATVDCRLVYDSHSYDDRSCGTDCRAISELIMSERY